MPVPLNGVGEPVAGQGSGSVPAFLSKLWHLVEDPKYDSFISWSSSGQSFIIHNQSCFAEDVLPQFFKHKNMASFIRQLNMYGFRKMVNIDSGGLKGVKDDIEFYHHYFVRDQESLLEFIKRKASAHSRGGAPAGGGQAAPAGSGSDELRNELVRELLTDVNQLQGKQEAVDTQLVEMKRENEALWREVAVLRRKHLKQQQIVEKLIRFLVTLVHQARAGPSDNNISMKRKHALMIDEGRKMRKTFKGPVRQQTMSADSGISDMDTGGPIIRDVTNDPVSPQSQQTTIGGGGFPDGISRASPILSSRNKSINNSRKQMCLGRDKFVPCTNQTVPEPLSMENCGDIMVESPGSIDDTGLCDGGDDVALCENLFDGDVVLPHALAHCPMTNDAGESNSASGLGRTGADGGGGDSADGVGGSGSVNDATNDGAARDDVDDDDNNNVDSIEIGDTTVGSHVGTTKTGRSLAISHGKTQVISPTSTTRQAGVPPPSSGETNFSSILDEVPFEDSCPPSTLNTPLVEWQDPGPSSSQPTPTTDSNGKIVQVVLQSPLRNANDNSVATRAIGGGKITPANTNGRIPPMAAVLLQRNGKSAVGASTKSGTFVTPALSSNGSYNHGADVGVLPTGQHLAGSPTGTRTPLQRLLGERHTDSLNEHCEGVDTELDWLQDQLLAGGLNIDSNTLMGIFNSEEMLPGLTSEVGGLGGSHVVTYQTPSFLDLISPDEPEDDRSFKLKAK